jgi:hypothetical protein
MLGVVFLGAITLSNVTQSCHYYLEHRNTECHCTVGVIKLSVIRLSVVIPRIVAPREHSESAVISTRVQF